MDESQYFTKAIARAQRELRNVGLSGELTLTFSYGDWACILRELRFLSEPGDTIRLQTEMGSVTIRLADDRPAPS